MHSISTRLLVILVKLVTCAKLKLELHAPFSSIPSQDGVTVNMPTKVTTWLAETILSNMHVLVVLTQSLGQVTPLLV